MARIVAEFRDRRDFAVNWTSKDPVLASGEHGYELDSGKFKIGNGVLRWNQLPYFAPQGEATTPVTQQDLIDHVESTSPHPEYDDGVSLTLLYENAKV
jgi:hypothetical protein